MRHDPCHLRYRKLRYNTENLDGRQLRVMLALFVAALMAVPVANASTPGVLSISRLYGGTSVKQVSGPVNLIFWRGDCGRCLTELRDLRELSRASGRTPFFAVGLDDPASLKRGAEKAGLAGDLLWRSQADPRATLASYGGLPARLPLRCP